GPAAHPARATRLLREVIAEVPNRRDNQVFVTLRPYKGIKLSGGESTFQQSTEDSELVADGAGVVMRARIGRGLLGIEVIHIHEPQPLRSGVEGCSDQVIAGSDPVELCERIDPALPFLIVWKRQRVHCRLADFVLASLGDEKLPRNNRSFE